MAVTSGHRRPGEDAGRSRKFLSVEHPTLAGHALPIVAPGDKLNLESVIRHVDASRENY
jgi:hypothetical protein